MSELLGDEEAKLFLTFETEGASRASAAMPVPPSATLTKSRTLSFLVIVLFFLATFCGLTALLLTLPPRNISVSDGSALSTDLDDANRDHNKAHDEKTSLHPQNHMAHAPQLRDTSEYILSPSWDHSATPKTREYSWVILDAVLNPDGVYRPMILINNQFPGPLIECNQDDTIIVHVQNMASNATSIHFHGLYQIGTNFMDGTVGVTQCPIAPGSNFTYAFNIRGQSGTYWYHAHHSAQASDGLVGPVVIHDQNERRLQKLEYATDRIIMVQDHYHNMTSELLMEYLQPDRENDEPVPDNPLINGRGLRSCDDFNGWHCDNSRTSRPIIDLVAGHRHRLRFINVGAFAEFQIQIDEHPFYVTEVDGTDVHPEPFHRLNILPAQRYSIVIETNITTRDTYWLRARMVSRCFTTKSKRMQAELWGVVRYILPQNKAPESEPESKDWPETVEVVCRDLNTSTLRPVQQVAPPPADHFVMLRTNFEIGDWALARGFFNSSTWRPNITNPSLHRFLDAAPSLTSMETSIGVNNKLFREEAELVLQTQGVQTVDIAINNFDDGAHPFHLHGHKFFVMAQAQSGYPPSAATLDRYMIDHGGWPSNPLRRDTVTVEAYSWAIIRVVLNNPGFWAFHCHNMWHAASGMVMQFLVQSETVSQWALDPRQRTMCEFPGVTTGARPDDAIWVGHVD